MAAEPRTAIAPPRVIVALEPFWHPEGVRLRAEQAAEVRRRYRPEDPGSDAEPVAEPWADDAVAFLVAREAGAPVGCVALRRVSPEVFELKRMYVRPAARGRRIADMLLAAAERRARELGAGRIILQSGTAQPEALTVYRRNGYEAISPFGEYASSPRSRCFGRDLR
jgi:GNAT superfamily N-acetyltransferase